MTGRWEVSIMKVRGFEHGAWSDTPTTTPRDTRGAETEFINGSLCIRCGGCGVWVPVWGADTAVVGHWGFRPNPYFERFNPRLGAVDMREHVPCVKSRRATVCTDCSFAFSAKRADAELVEHVWIPDVLQRSR